MFDNVRRSFAHVPVHLLTFVCSCSRSFTHVHLLTFWFVYSRSFAHVPFRLFPFDVTFVCSHNMSRSFTLVLSIRNERYSDQRFESHVRLQKPVTITRSFANVNLHTCSRDRTITLVYYLQKSSSQQ